MFEASYHACSQAGALVGRWRASPDTGVHVALGIEENSSLIQIQDEHRISMACETTVMLLRTILTDENDVSQCFWLRQLIHRHVAIFARTIWFRCLFLFRRVHGDLFVTECSISLSSGDLSANVQWSC